jgi:hypothetical protein
MNSTFVVTLLISAALFFSLGYFLASVALSQSIRNDLADLDAERAALDEEREMLTRFWTLDVAPPADDRVEFALGEQKRLTRTVS